MSRALELLERLHAGAPLADGARELGAELEQVGAFDGLQELLAASSLLLHAASRQGEWQAVDIGRGLAALESVRGPDAETVILAVGRLGSELLSAWTRTAGGRPALRALLLDCDSAMIRRLPGGVPRIILDVREGSDGPIPCGHGEAIRAAYRAAASPGGPPPAVADILLEPRAGHLTLHVVIGLEDPWIAAAPDLAIDLRALLGHARSRIVLHLLTRPAPRVRGAALAALEELQQSRPADDVFLVCGADSAMFAMVSELVRLADEAPEILTSASTSAAPPLKGRPPGVFASYGVAELRIGAGAPAGERLQAIDDALLAASPSWLPGSRPLPELVAERVFLIHDADQSPPDEIWRVCPEVMLVPIPGAAPRLCRMQRGLTLAELRLGAR